MAGVEPEHLGEVLDRPSGTPLPRMAEDAERDADRWAGVQQSRAGAGAAGSA